MVAQVALLGVVRCDQKRLAGVAHRQALTLHYVDALRQHVEQQVADAVVQKVQLVDVQDATVGLRQKAWLEHRLARLHRLLNVHSPEEAILRDPERDLHEGSLLHNSLHLAVPELVTQTVLPLSGVFGVGVAVAILDAIDGRHELLEAACHDRLCGTATTGDEDTAELRVHGAQKERRLDVLLTLDLRKGVLGPLSAIRNGGSAHVGFVLCDRSAHRMLRSATVCARDTGFLEGTSSHRSAAR
mmetsp:Transcript_1003/g.1774  ORF Transcript_1003/g.1774 Transcript_1003/m.1774 type:complete len:243 (+) Transcript_1003:429-1157(+)